jgi:hypothetical protein
MILNSIGKCFFKLEAAHTKVANYLEFRPFSPVHGDCRTRVRRLTTSGSIMEMPSNVWFRPWLDAGQRLNSPSNLITTSGVSMGKYAFCACLVFCKCGDGSCFSDPDRLHLICMTTTDSRAIWEAIPMFLLSHFGYSARHGILGNKMWVAQWICL